MRSIIARTVAASLALATALPASAQNAYFRLNAQGSATSGSTTPPPNDTTSTDPNAPATAPSTTFFVAADPDFASSASPGQPVGAAYDVVGGVPPYSVRFLRSVPGLDLPTSATPLAGSSVQVAGTPNALGTVLGIPFVVTDSAGTTVGYTTAAFTVEPAPTQIVITPTSGVPTTLVQGQAVSATYTVTGGQDTSYAASFDTQDPGLKVKWNGQPGGCPPGSGGFYFFGHYIPGTCYNTFTISGTPTTTGANAAMTLSVTDGLGDAGSYVVGPFAVQPSNPSTLAIVPAPDLPATLALGTSATATYRFSGGTPPYRATVAPLVPGFASSFEAPVDVVNADGTVTPGVLNTMDVTGAPTKAGTAPPMLVSLTDGAGHSATFLTKPFIVTGAAQPLQVFAGVYDASLGDPYVAGTDVSDNASPQPYAYGGVPPIALSVLPNPAGLFYVDRVGTGANGFANEVDGALHGSVTTPGVVSGLTVVATDAAGTVAQAVVPDFVVSPSPLPATLAFSKVTDLQSTVASGATASASFSATGGVVRTGPFGNVVQPTYTFSVDNAPSGFSMVQAVAGGPDATLTGVASESGSYPDTVVSVTDGTGTANYQVAPYTVGPGKGLCIVQPLPTADIGSYSGTQGLTGVVGCGTGPYVGTLGPGTGPSPVYVENNGDGSFFLGFGAACANAGSTSVKACPEQALQVGQYSGYKLTVTDANGQSISFPPLALSVNQSDPKLICEFSAEGQGSGLDAALVYANANGRGLGVPVEPSVSYWQAVAPISVALTGMFSYGPVTYDGTPFGPTPFETEDPTGIMFLFARNPDQSGTNTALGLYGYSLPDYAPLVGPGQIVPETLTLTAANGTCSFTWIFNGSEKGSGNDAGASE